MQYRKMDSGKIFFLFPEPLRIGPPQNQRTQGIAQPKITD